MRPLGSAGGTGVDVGAMTTGAGVFVGGTRVAVTGTGVAVGCVGEAVGGRVTVGGGGVAVGTRVKVAAGTAVGGVVGAGLAVGATTSVGVAVASAAPNSPLNGPPGTRTRIPARATTTTPATAAPNRPHGIWRACVCGSPKAGKGVGGGTPAGGWTAYPPAAIGGGA